MRLRLAIGLLSGAAIAHQLLLMRLLSIVQWHHFAFMVISLALLGYGASGAFLTVVRRPLVDRFGFAFSLLAALFAISTVASFSAAQRLPLNPLEIMWDVGQLAALAEVYLLLAAPFFCAGAAIGLALMRFRESVHGIYRADLVGAAFGAVAALTALSFASPATCLRLAGLVGWLAAAVTVPVGDPLSGRRAARSAEISEEPRQGPLPRAVILAVASTLVGLLLWPQSWLAPRMSQYKAQSKALAVPGAQVVAERSSPLGEIAAVRSPQVPFRVAPGLSFSFTGLVPEQTVVFSDGELAAVVDPAAAGDTGLDYFDYLPSALPFQLVDRPRVALLDTGGGSALALALRQGASEVHVVETDPQLLEILAEDLAEFTGGLHRDRGVHLHGMAPRGFFTADAGLFDLIWLQPAGSSSPAAHSLRESYELTLEALALYTSRLRQGGVLAVDGEVEVPPRASLKLVAALAETLAASGLDPATRIAAVRSWNRFLLLVKPAAWTTADLAAVRAFCSERGFDPVYVPGMTDEEAAGFDLAGGPDLFRSIATLLGPDRRRLVADYKFDLRPATDDRPYFSHFMRWSSLGELLRLRTRGGAALVEWGYVLLVATLLQAALAGFVLILVPLWAVRRKPSPGGAWRTGVYFLSLGLGFLLLEIAYIHRLTLYLADPLRAVATALTAFLLFAGLGSGASRGLERRWPRGALPSVLVGTVLVAAGSLFIVPPLLRAGLGLPLGIKLGIACALTAPLAFLMGMPFPLGLRRLAAARPDLVPWAWGVNGWASVLAAVLATLLAVHFGFTIVVVTACALYALAALTRPSPAP